MIYCTLDKCRFNNTVECTYCPHYVKNKPKNKPCPFCGEYLMTACNTKFGWQVYCSNDDCFMNEIICTTGWETEQDAIQAWNKRTTQ